MKVVNIICLIVLLYAGSSAQDQIKRGVYSLGGTISYSSSTTKYYNDEFSNSIYTIAPSISYFFIDQFELSFGTGYTSSSVKYSGSDSESKNISLTVNFGMRFYYPLGTFAPFIGAGGQISWTTPYYEWQSFLPPTTGYTVTGGSEIFIAQSVAIELAVVYTKIRNTSQSSSNFIPIVIGVKYFIL
jgi:opacity protein-like surface antigen